MKSQEAGERHAPQGADAHPAWGNPRFSIGGMLLGVAGLSLVLASSTWFGALGAIVVGFFALAVLAHVMGNWLGNELRDLGNRARSPAERTQEKPMPHEVQSHHFAPTTSLRQHHGTTWFVRISVILAVLLSTPMGVVMLHAANGSRASWTSAICGGLACGVLGGFAAFLCASFLQAGWNALQQAARHQ